jgi:sodium pump decarboxylase gamma subunit
MVVLLGMGIVFIGLGLLVLLCTLMRLVLHREEAAQAAPQAVATAAPEVTGAARQKLLAAVTAAIAEAEGTDAPGFRIVSFERRQQA